MAWGRYKYGKKKRDDYVSEYEQVLVARRDRDNERFDDCLSERYCDKIYKKRDKILRL